MLVLIAIAHQRAFTLAGRLQDGGRPLVLAEELTFFVSAHGQSWIIASVVVCLGLPSLIFARRAGGQPTAARIGASTLGFVVAMWLGLQVLSPLSEREQFTAALRSLHSLTGESGRALTAATVAIDSMWLWAPLVYGSVLQWGSTRGKDSGASAT